MRARAPSQRAPAGKLTTVYGGQFVVCHFCQMAWRDLGMHVVAKHRLSIATYCRTWSLPPDTKLISPTLAAKRADDPWLANGRL
jgi:predicted transcriptional regulator